ncbi:MAG TPA: LysR family transcriptional regulator [Capillimicrobium sp.]|nr:LysR family transcriptional regulator [Capillimicrobium sp.]
MELRQLRYFVAVARHGSFTRAAEELWLTQSALSQQIRRLENEVGVPLLARTSRGAELTAAGEQLLARAERALAEVDAARAELGGHAGATAGRVRVAATAVDGARLPAALAAFHRRHPGIQVALRHASASEAAALAARGSVDLAVVGLAGAAPAGAVVAAELAEPLRAMLPAGASGPVALADLREEPFVLAEPGSPLRDAVMAACQAAGFSPVPLLEVSDPATVRHLVEAGLGVSIAPASWFDASVAEVALVDPPPAYRVALLTPAAGPSPAGRLLLEHLV